jgi:hypothetical protein
MSGLAGTGGFAVGPEKLAALVRLDRLLSDPCSDRPQPTTRATAATSAVRLARSLQGTLTLEG